MMAVDERQTTSGQAAAEVERLAGEFNASVATLKVEQQSLGVHLSKLIEKRGRQAALAQPALLKSYDQLIQEKRGLAVAGLRGSKCQACQMTLSGTTIRAAAEGKVVRCDSCGRILCPL